MRKRKAPTPLQLERRKRLELEELYSPFSHVTLDAIDRAAERHPYKPLCNRDLTTLSDQEKKKVKAVVRQKIQNIRRILWLGNEED